MKCDTLSFFPTLMVSQDLKSRFAGEQISFFFFLFGFTPSRSKGASRASMVEFNINFLRTDNSSCY